MVESTFLGTLIVLAGGISTGCFPLPMKFTRKWAWENIWLVYAVVGLLILPWVVAITAVPDLMAVYEATSTRTLWLTAAFGFGWGVGNVLFGEGVAMVGMALAFAVVGGFSAAAGSLIPLLVLRPDRFSEPSGMVILLGVVIAVSGIAVLGAAGRRREKLQGKGAGSGSVVLGVGLCVLSGFLGSMLNFSFAFGSGIADQAIKHGATASSASHAIWAIAFLGGFFSNGGYAAIKLVRGGTWRLFAANAGSGVLSGLMGILFTTGFLLYGLGANLLGALGPVVGWPALQATTIIVSTIAGAMSGEWRGTDRTFVWMNVAGLAILVVAIVILSIGNRL